MRPPTAVTLIVILLYLVAAGCASQQTLPRADGQQDTGVPRPPASAVEARVTRVVDGDTFVTGAGNRIRLLGINAPESADPRRPVQSMGREASAFARELLQGQAVLIQPGRNPRDRYGRTLAWVWLKDGRFVNGELVRLGFAQVYTFPDNPDYAQYLLRLEQEAREANRGLWSR